MYTNNLTTAKHNKRFFAISMAVTFISTSTYAITPEQYQEQRGDALKQQQIITPNVTIDTNAFKTAPSTPSASTTVEGVSQNLCNCL